MPVAIKCDTVAALTANWGSEWERAKESWRTLIARRHGIDQLANAMHLRPVEPHKACNGLALMHIPSNNIRKCQSMVARVANSARSKSPTRPVVQLPTLLRRPCSP